MKLSNNTTVSYYSLVVAIAKRAREIAAEAELKGEILVEKPVDLAVNEYIEGAFRIVEPRGRRINQRIAESREESDCAL